MHIYIFLVPEILIEIQMRVDLAFLCTVLEAIY